MFLGHQAQTMQDHPCVLDQNSNLPTRPVARLRSHTPVLCKCNALNFPPFRVRYTRLSARGVPSLEHRWLWLYTFSNHGSFVEAKINLPTTKLHIVVTWPVALCHELLGGDALPAGVIGSCTGLRDPQIPFATRSFTPATSLSLHCPDNHSNSQPRSKQITFSMWTP
jgi:hypothetical protein